MTLRPVITACSIFFATLAVGFNAHSSAQWRSYKKADGLPENACASVTPGASGNVLVRHSKSSVISVFDGYEFTLIPATNHHRAYESPGGQLWSLTDDGLCEWRDGEWTAHPVAAVAEHLRSGRTNEIRLLPFRQGRVFILLPDRLLQLDAEDPDNPRVELFRYADEPALGGFTAMIPARDGGAWIAAERGFAKLPPPLHRLKPSDPWLITNSMPEEFSASATVAVTSDTLSVRRIHEIAAVTDDVICAATSDGLFCRAPGLWVAESAPQVARRKTELPQMPNDIAILTQWTAAFTAATGDVWVGGGNHIAWRHGDKWRVFSSTNQFGPEQVVAFTETPDGRIWCATPGKVWWFNGTEWMTARGGFDQINALLGGRDGTLWVATAHGVFRHARNAWLQNGAPDGLPSENILDITEDNSGIVRVETTAGWSRFQPDADRAAPRTYIRAAEGTALHFRESAVVTFAFDGRDRWKQTAPDRLLFSYRFDDSDWSAFQPEREVPLAGLALGRHFFQVRAMDRNGNVDTRMAQAEFHIVLPWYRETRLVVVLAVALVIALFFAGLAFNRKRRLQRSYAEVERQVAERTRELERANRELLHSQKMNALGTLSAGIAHDFNNILSIVKGSAQIIEDNADNPEKIRTRVDRIKTVVQQGAEVVDAMLGFSRSTDAPPAPCDVNAVVADTRKLLGDRFLREAEVRIERGEDLPEISVSRDFVQQILLNLIFNAAEAATAHKQIIISTRVVASLQPELILAPATATRFILISVHDNGSGIAPDVLPRIFEPFFTTKAMSARRGTGLGLSMVYELAKKLEAGLAVESTVGKGSTFTLILPVNPK